MAAYISSCVDTCAAGRKIMSPFINQFMCTVLLKSPAVKSPDWCIWRDQCMWMDRRAEPVHAPLCWCHSLYSSLKPGPVEPSDLQQGFLTLIYNSTRVVLLLWWILNVFISLGTVSWSISFKYGSWLQKCFGNHDFMKYSTLLLSNRDQWLGQQITKPTAGWEKRLFFKLW